MPHPIEIRDATVADLPRIFELYNREVERSAATFDTERREPGRDDAWLTERDAIHPVLVGVRNGDVVGWGSLGQWSQRGAYLRTAEVSVYVDVAVRGGGNGTVLLAALIERARSIDELHVLLSRIALPNPASIAIAESFGFRSIGTQRACGEKFGQVLDVELLDLHLD